MGVGRGQMRRIKSINNFKVRARKKDPHWERAIIIGVAGRKRVGKDSTADHFTNIYNNTIKINFSDPILEEVNAMLAVHNIKIDSDNKERYRPLLQEWGDLRREQDEDYWNKQVEQKINRCVENGEKLILACGPRAASEFEMIKACGGELWKVIRPLEATDQHSTEQSVDTYDNFDRYIRNDRGILHLQEQVEKTLDTLLEERDLVSVEAD